WPQSIARKASIRSISRPSSPDCFSSAILSRTSRRDRPRKIAVNSIEVFHSDRDGKVKKIHLGPPLASVQVQPVVSRGGTRIGRHDVPPHVDLLGVVFPFQGFIEN